MRLWTVTKAKELCGEWNMKIFFRIVHNDVEKCLEHLNDLRLPGECNQKRKEASPTMHKSINT